MVEKKEGTCILIFIQSLLCAISVSNLKDKTKMVPEGKKKEKDAFRPGLTNGLISMAA